MLMGVIVRANAACQEGRVDPGPQGQADSAKSRHDGRRDRFGNRRQRRRSWVPSCGPAASGRRHGQSGSPTPAAAARPACAARRSPRSPASASITSFVSSRGATTIPRREVLLALADAMRLTEDERRHLYQLGLIPETKRCARRRSISSTWCHRPSQGVLDALDPMPAFVIGPIGDVLAWNRRVGGW